MGKSRFDKFIWGEYGKGVSYYHGNHVIFTADEYRKYCDEKRQPHSFAVVVSQDYNVQAERAIQTIIYMVWTFMVYTSLH